MSIKNPNRTIAVVGSRTVGRDNLCTIGRVCVELFGRLNKHTDTILSGGCGSGADYWAKALSGKGGFQYLEAPALWQAHGKAAGPLRNKTIAQHCTHMVAVWDGKSAGTKQAIDAAMFLGKPVWIVWSR